MCGTLQRQQWRTPANTSRFTQLRLGTGIPARHDKTSPQEGRLMIWQPRLLLSDQLTCYCGGTLGAESTTPTSTQPWVERIGSPVTSLPLRQTPSLPLRQAPSLPLRQTPSLPLRQTPSPTVRQTPQSTFKDKPPQSTFKTYPPQSTFKTYPPQSTFKDSRPVYL